MKFILSRVRRALCLRSEHSAWLVNDSFIVQFMRIGVMTLVITLTALQLLIAADIKAQHMDSTQVTLGLNEESLEDALKKIEKLTPFRFVYRNNEIKNITRLNLPEGTRSLSQTLTLLLDKTSLTFREVHQNILIERLQKSGTASVQSPDMLTPQDFPVTGTVRDATNDTPLPGVSILVKGTQVGTVSDAQGNYSLNAPSGSSVLIFSFIGYKTTEIEISQRSVVNLSLETDLTQLDEVVVTSFGIEQEKQSLGFSTQNVSGESLTQMRQPNVVNALQGQVAGVQITNSGGAPGMSSRIIVRGITSLDPNASNQPLFVVDGIPIDNSTYETASGASENTPRGLSNRAMDINPNDIESVSVLKGAAATALYGVRAANGAIVITTKKGKAGKVQITASSTFGMDRINKYPSFQDKYGQGSNGLYAPDDIFPGVGCSDQRSKPDRSGI